MRLRLTGRHFDRFQEVFGRLGLFCNWRCAEDFEARKVDDGEESAAGEDFGIDGAMGGFRRARLRGGER